VRQPCERLSALHVGAEQDDVAVRVDHLDELLVALADHERALPQLGSEIVPD
jgi:hypothetical protein